MASNQLAELGRLHGVNSGLGAIGSGLGVDLLDRKAAAQLEAVTGKFRGNGAAAVTSAAATSDLVAPLSRLSELGIALEHARKLAG
jgi:hypothetical protein